MDDRAELIERLEKLTGPIDGVTAGALANAFSPWETESVEWSLFIRALRPGLEALGAAVALVERAKPKLACLAFVQNCRPAKAGFVYPDDTRVVYFEAATPAIALLIALLRSDKEAG